jgi:transcription initiation protein SPT3
MDYLEAFTHTDLRVTQMMFVSGETADPSSETLWMIEEIVREQVVEMVRFSSLASVRS